MVSLTLLGVIEILKEALKIFSKNGKLMASIALFTLLTKSILLLSLLFSIKPLMADFLIEQHLLKITTPNSPDFTSVLTHMRKDIKILFGLEVLYIILDYAASLLSTTATILAAAITHGGKKDDLSLKELLLRTARSWKRPLVTGLCVFLFALVYIFILAILLLVIVLVSHHNPLTSAGGAIFLGVLAYVFYIYLSVEWTLAIVVSVAEQIRGFEALGKAAEIVKGMKLQGFLLNLVFAISGVFISLGTKLVLMTKSRALEMVLSLFIVSLACLVRMYWFVAFTVFYYRCKKTHGEIDELEGSSSSDGYSKISTSAPIVADNIP